MQGVAWPPAPFYCKYTFFVKISQHFSWNKHNSNFYFYFYMVELQEADKPIFAIIDTCKSMSRKHLGLTTQFASQGMDWPRRRFVHLPSESGEWELNRDRLCSNRSPWPVYYGDDNKFVINNLFQILYQRQGYQKADDFFHIREVS